MTWNFVDHFWNYFRKCTLKHGLQFSRLQYYYFVRWKLTIKKNWNFQITLIAEIYGEIWIEIIWLKNWNINPHVWIFEVCRWFMVHLYLPSSCEILSSLLLWQYFSTRINFLVVCSVHWRVYTEARGSPL